MNRNMYFSLYYVYINNVSKYDTGGSKNNCTDKYAIIIPDVFCFYIHTEFYKFGKIHSFDQEFHKYLIHLINIIQNGT